jgi:hypothetical protein
LRALVHSKYRFHLHSKQSASYKLSKNQPHRLQICIFSSLFYIIAFYSQYYMLIYSL